MNLPPPHVIDHDTSVFINCPFDDGYRDYRQAITLTVIAHGFRPICGLDLIDHRTPRLLKLLKLVVSTRYSIHDFTRCRGEGGDENLARFNMPLELGMALLESHRSAPEHDYMVLVPDQHTYKKFVSDLSGNDFSDYKEDCQSIIGSVLRWLRTRENCVAKPTVKQVMSLWGEFRVKRDREMGNYPDQEDLPQDVLLGLMVGLCAKKKWWQFPRWLPEPAPPRTRAVK